MATVAQEVSFFAERGEFLDKLTVLLKTSEVSTADSIVKRLTEIVSD
jgi:pilus assembly protein TadC